MNLKALDGYKNIKTPSSCLYRKELNNKEIFREYDSPLAFLDLKLEKQLILYKWCSSLDKIKKSNKKHSSYGLKHVFAREKQGFYVYNGAFKGAMIVAGFITEDVKDLNWLFNVSEKSIKNILIEQRKRGRRS